MNVKKYTLSLLLLMISNTFGMELALSPKDNEKCLRVAGYLAKIYKREEETKQSLFDVYEREKIKKFFNKSDDVCAQQIRKYVIRWRNKDYFLQENNVESIFHVLPCELRKVIFRRALCDDAEGCYKSQLGLMGRGGSSVEHAIYYGNRNVMTKACFDNSFDACMQGLALGVDKITDKFIRMQKLLKFYPEFHKVPAWSSNGEAVFFASLEKALTVENEDWDVDFLENLRFGEQPIKFIPEIFKKWQAMPQSKRDLLCPYFKIEVQDDSFSVVDCGVKHASLLTGALAFQLFINFLEYYAKDIKCIFGIDGSLKAVIATGASVGIFISSICVIPFYGAPWLKLKSNPHLSLVKACIQEKKTRTFFESYQKSIRVTLCMANVFQVGLAELVYAFEGLVSYLWPNNTIGWIIHGIKIPMYYVEYKRISAKDPIKSTWKIRDLKKSV